MPIYPAKERADKVDELRKQQARKEGEHYLRLARQALSRGDKANARRLIKEGLINSSGPFYIAVRDQLHDLQDAIPPMNFDELEERHWNSLPV